MDRAGLEPAVSGSSEPLAKPVFAPTLCTSLDYRPDLFFSLAYFNSCVVGQGGVSGALLNRRPPGLSQ